MLRSIVLLAIALGSTASAQGAAKPHLIHFGKWNTVKWFIGGDKGQSLDLKVRALYVDGRLKEYTVGDPHEVTDRLFVVRRAFRVNDALPDDKTAAPRWQWQRGGWLLAERNSGRVSPLNLPDFDALYSATSWYRDYAAYCGVSLSGAKLYLIVTQLGQRRPILRKVVDQAITSDTPDSLCAGTNWQRQPMRVTFVISQEQKATYEVRGRAADLVPEDDEDDEQSKQALR